MGVGWQELLIILLIVLVLFGGGKLSKIGSDLGAGIRNFKESMKGDEKKPEPPADKTAEKDGKPDAPSKPS